MIKDFIQEFRPYLCDSLYHYCSLRDYSRIESIIRDHRIFFQSPKQFNDPFDCKPNIVLPGSLSRDRYLKNFIKQKFPNADSREQKKILKQSKQRLTISNLKQLSDSFIADNGVFCLSETKENLLLWAHYADSHKGICFIFKSNEIRTVFWDAMKVKYQLMPPRIDPTKFPEEKEELFKTLLIKSEHWKYEEEWRIVRPKLERGVGYQSFKPELLKGIILGVEISEKNKKKLLKDSRNYNPEIEIFEAKLIEDEYKLDFDNI